MPAVSLNTLQPEKPYDLDKQKDFFKLWLLLTTNPYVINKATKICTTTAKAQDFVKQNENTPDPLYYLDLELLGQSLSLLSSGEIASVVGLLNPNNQDFFDSATSTFHSQGEVVMNYDKVYCSSVQNVLHV